MISRRIFSGLVFFSALFAFSSSVGAAELSFYSYRDAVEIAKSHDKMVYVLFGGDHCPWCHKQKDVLAKDSVAEALFEHVVCYVDTSEEKELASKHRIRSIPVSMLMDSEEKVIKKSVGYMDESKFLNWIR